MRLLFILSLTVVLASCGSRDEDAGEVQLVVPDTILVWNTNADSMIMKRDQSIPDTAITVSRIINGLNEKYPGVKLVLIKQNQDTLFTRIPNGEYLGNQMGSAGAAAWFADAVINLTSVAGINYVSFDMDTFSHASGTVVGKDNYKNWKRQ